MVCPLCGYRTVLVTTDGRVPGRFERHHVNVPPSRRVLCPASGATLQQARDRATEPTTPPEPGAGRAWAPQVGARRDPTGVMGAVNGGQMTITEVLYLADTSPGVARIKVSVLLSALPGATPAEVARLMVTLDLAHSRRLGALNALERLELHTLSATRTPPPETTG